MELTQTEREIMELVGDGWLDKEIAFQRGRAVSTIKNQMVVIYDKLGVRNRAEAVKKLFGGK